MSDFGSSRTQKIRLPESSNPAADYNGASGYHPLGNGHAESVSLLPTVGQLMRSTAQAIQHLYRDRLGHMPSKVTCNLLNNKLLVWVEDSVTRPEQVLMDADSTRLPEISLIIKEGLKKAITEVVERHLKVAVVTVLSDTCYEQSCTAMVVLLSSPPSVRSSRTRY